MKLLQDVSVRGTTVLVATHDLDLIRAAGRRCVTLDRGRVVEGLVEAALPPQAATKRGDGGRDGREPPDSRGEDVP